MRRTPATAALTMMLAGWISSAQALHIVSDDIPDGNIKVAVGEKAPLYLDINPKDILQWSWSATSGDSSQVSTRLLWTDTTGRQHSEAFLPPGQLFGNFQAPDDLLGAHLEWNNQGETPVVISWSYYTTASFWRRPEYFLPAMLPLFLLAGAYYFGRRLDRGRPVASVAEPFDSKETST